MLQSEGLRALSPGQSPGGSVTPVATSLCCHACNEFKGDFWVTGPNRLIYPLDPALPLHIMEEPDGKLRGLTETGQFHIEWLHLNRQQLVVYRHERRLRNDALETHQELLRQLSSLENRVNQVLLDLKQIKNEFDVSSFLRNAGYHGIMLKIVPDVACTVCGCVCDDITVTIENDRIIRADNACRLAEPWFLKQNAAKPQVAWVDDRPASFADAIAKAVEILRSARSPLIYGLSRSTTEGQRVAVALAEKLGATIDTTASTGHATSIMALQQVGESTCTLGEAKNRADLVIFWGCDPVRTHPRHLERYAGEAVGRWVPNGRADRYIVVADVQETDSARVADQYLPIETGRDWGALWPLRLLVKGIDPRPGSVTGAPLDKLRELAKRMKTCRFGVIFFGAGLARGTSAHRAIEALLQLVTDLNQHTRFYARRMRRFGDVAGADSVLAWQTGYPFGVNFATGYPRYNPGEFTGPEMLMRGEVDACVVLDSETVADFPKAAHDALNAIPVIALDPPGAEYLVPAAVRFTTAVYGVHRPGTAYRLDEVPIPLRVLLPTDYPSDGEVLETILAKYNE